MSSKRFWSKLRISIAALVLLALPSAMNTRAVVADELQPRTVLVGSSYATEVTTHTFTFRTATAGPVGSIEFLYCSNSPLFDDPCTAPSGMDADNFTLGDQTGITGFSKNAVETGVSRAVISRAPAAEIAQDVEYELENITNPDNTNSTVYVRISVYASNDATGIPVDTGAVAFPIEDPFDVDAYVPPYLTFCVAVSVALDCSTATGFLSEFGEFSTSSTITATTQMSASTNDPNGYNIYLNGQTMTSGNNIIAPLISRTNSVPGVSQFGLNLRQNTNPTVGTNPQQGPVGSGAARGDYAIPNQFAFNNGAIVAGSLISSGFTRYTVSYIVNIADSQPPGIYATSLQYTALATF